MQNGKEWRSWGHDSVPRGESVSPGLLEATRIDTTHFQLSFTPSASMSPAVWRVYGALLSSGTESNVRSGENSGKTLHHEFIVLELNQAIMTLNNKKYLGQITLPSAGSPSARLAFWIVREGELTPIQSVGGEL